MKNSHLVLTSKFIYQKSTERKKNKNSSFYPKKLEKIKKMGKQQILLRTRV